MLRPECETCLEMQNLYQIVENIIPNFDKVPTLEGIDMHAEVIPNQKDFGGDHILFLDFKEEIDLEAMIEKARKNNPQLVEPLSSLYNKVGILLQDACGHLRTDIFQIVAGLSAFQIGVYHDLEHYGRVTEGVLPKLNAILHKIGSEGKFTTAQYIEVDNSGLVKFYSAGHPAPIFFTYNENRITTRDADIGNTGLPLGLVESAPNGIILKNQQNINGGYESNDWLLSRKGDMMLFTTDGVRELENNGQLYLDSELESVLKSNRDSSAKDISHALRESLLAFGNQKDDMSYVVVKRV